MVLAILLLLFLLLGRKKPSKTFATQKVEKGKIEVTVSASGTVRSESEAKVQFQTSGKLAWLGVKEGDSVKKWQALASLDKDDLKKRFQKEMNDYLNERWDFEQKQDDYKTTKERSLVTDSIKRILEKAQFDLNNSVLDLEISDLTVKYATVYSPIEGIITAMEPSVPGVNVLYTSAYIEVADPNKMEFEAIVDEVDVSKLQVGQLAIITLDAFSNEEFPGVVKRIGFKSIVTNTGGTGYLVYFSLPAESFSRLRIGFNGDIEVVAEKKDDVLLIPVDSLLEEEGKKFVFRVREGKAIKTEVIIGLDDEVNVEIASGLNQDDLIIVENVSLLKDNQQIKVR